MIFDKERFLDSINFEVMGNDMPTLKQIELVKDICYAFNKEYPPDGIKTKKEFTKYISDNLKEYKEICWDAYVFYMDHYENFGDRV